MTGRNDNGDAPVVLITGAAQRIGAALARTLHADGWQVLVHYRSSGKAAEALVAELNGSREGSARALQADLLEVAACGLLIDEALEGKGRLDALINNASTFYPTPLERISAEDFERLVGSNLRAPLFLAQAAAPALRQARGSIINLADVHGLQAMPGYAPYTAAKAGLIMLTRTLARELAPEVRVNAIAPGHVLPASHDGDIQREEKTVGETIPLGRQGTTEDIAAAVRFLLSGEASYITGTVLPVDGGKLLG